MVNPKKIPGRAGEILRSLEGKPKKKVNIRISKKRRPIGISKIEKQFDKTGKLLRKKSLDKEKRLKEIEKEILAKRLKKPQKKRLDTVLPQQKRNILSQTPFERIMSSNLKKRKPPIRIL